MHSYVSVAQVSTFGFDITEIAVNESIGTLDVCAVLVSQGPLLFPAVLNIVNEDGSATGRVNLCVPKLLHMF